MSQQWSVLNCIVPSRAIQPDVHAVASRGQPNSMNLQYIDHLPVWISQQLYHTFSTCSVKWKLKSIVNTKDLPLLLPQRGKGCNEAWHSDTDRAIRLGDMIYVGSKQLWYRHSSSLPPIISNTLIVSTRPVSFTVSEGNETQQLSHCLHKDTGTVEILFSLCQYY